MSDVVVTVPMTFGLDRWIGEGDPAGARWSGQEWHFYLGGRHPRIEPGERVYVVFNGALRGYAPFVRIDVDEDESWRYGLVRHGGAVAVTIPERIPGFRGWRYRWWPTIKERPFPDWQDPKAQPWLNRGSLATPAPAAGQEERLGTTSRMLRTGMNHRHVWVPTLSPDVEACEVHGCTAMRRAIPDD